MSGRYGKREQSVTTGCLVCGEPVGDIHTNDAARDTPEGPIHFRCWHLRRCPICGRRLRDVLGGRPRHNRRYCSDACKQKAYRERDRYGSASTSVTRVAA